MIYIIPTENLHLALLRCLLGMCLMPASLYLSASVSIAP